MADPNRPTDEPAASLPPEESGADRPAPAVAFAPAPNAERRPAAEPPARETTGDAGELAPTVAPEAARADASAQVSGRTPPADDSTRTVPTDDSTRALPTDDSTRTLPADDSTRALPAEQPTERFERAEDRDVTPAPPPPAPRDRTPVSPAAAPPPPRQQNNRLVGTAWVLLASLIFEILYVLGFALLVLVEAGAPEVGRNVADFLKSPFVWLPVLLFFLFYELTVLLVNRAGRYLYVLASLVVAVIVYVLFAVLYLAMQSGGLANEQSLGRALVLGQFVLVGVVAREAMLWTGLAIGARGKRVRRRNRAARDEYERTLAGQEDDGARAAG
ncbi:MAG: hypothetical protein QOE37_521 [Microbacteriaceae bacterium]|jgi:hypothetical protein|nr:hypothetical protein [Microbacteriaceae bacterium]